MNPLRGMARFTLCGNASCAKDHASVFGHHLAALMFFGGITDMDPMTIGYDQVARDLGIDEQQALFLQALAIQTLRAVPEPETIALLFTGLAGIVAARRRKRHAMT